MNRIQKAMDDLQHCKGVNENMKIIGDYIDNSLSFEQTGAVIHVLQELMSAKPMYTMALMPIVFKLKCQMGVIKDE